MLCKQNLKTKSLRFLIALCCILLSYQTLAAHQKPLQVVFERGQFFIVPVENSTKAIKVRHEQLKANMPHLMGTSGTNHAPQSGHIYLSLNTTNKE